MNQLEKARQEIDGIDAAIATLFAKRMHAVAAVAQYKKEKALPIFDAARENDVIRRNAARVEDPVLRSFYVLFLKEQMNCAKKYEQRLLQGQRIAYSGIAGGFSEIAARRTFPDAQRISFPDFAATYRAVQNGTCDGAILPIENSYAGEVGTVTDLLFFGDLYITGMTELAVVQNLVALPQSSLSDIHRVISHPQALAQCEAFIREKGFEQSTAENTALAARLVQKAADKHLAAIASVETAQLYGLQVLVPHINQSEENTTKFVILSRSAAECAPDTTGLRSMLLLTVNHEAGSLARAVDVIGHFGYNMILLRSRPAKSVRWHYYFEIELEGNLQTDKGAQMLQALRPFCETLRLGGVYECHTCEEQQEAAEHGTHSGSIGQSQL